MKFVNILLISLVLLLSPLISNAQDLKATDILIPDTTILYAQKDTNTLYLDIFYPKQGTDTVYNGQKKPTIIYIFGGGFIFGKRNDILPTRWYKQLTENGFTVIAIDYRLGLKGVKNPNKFKVAAFERAIDIAVEDLFSATKFLIDHGQNLNIDADNIIITGSSAGAIAALQADYELNNGADIANILPNGFKYKGVISFSGGIFAREGLIDYKSVPSPTLLLHGTDDHIVPYHKIQFFNIGFFGSDKLAKRFDKYKVNYNILRYKNHGHEIASAMLPTIKEQLRFIYTNIMDKENKIIDSTIDDPNISNRFRISKLKDIYKNK